MEPLIITIIVLAIILLYVIVTRNSLVILKNRVEDQYSQIDIQLKRRFDLIPNLVETVKGYIKHEHNTLEDVVKARNSYLYASNPNEKIKYDNELNSALNNLMIVIENYPDLKANQSFLKLQSELAQTEDKIAYARQFYNDSVLKLNNKIELFPSNIVAKVFRFKKENFINISSDEKQNVKVKF